MSVQGHSAPHWAINLQHGGLTSEGEATRERRALVYAYVGTWIFGIVMATVYVALFASFDMYYAATIATLLIGLAYGHVMFKPGVGRVWALVSLVITVLVLLVMGLHLQQPGANNFLLVPLVFATFFVWRERRLFIIAWAFMVVSYCALPLIIGGSDELRRVVIGGSIFTLVGVLTFLLVRRAGKLQLERSTFQSTVSSLLTALNARHGGSRQLTVHNVGLAEDVAIEMGLSETDREQVRYATYLHDLGKLGVPNELFDQRGPLTSEDSEMLRRHPVIGERIIKSVPGFDDVAVIVRHEHEHWNGSGFPDGLSGDRIPIESRIILACTVYAELLAAENRFGNGLAENVAGELLARAGTQFDPDVVTALLAVAEREDSLRAGRVLDLSLRLAG